MRGTDHISSDYLRRLKVVECPDASFVSHDPALVFAKGQGSVVTDADGNSFVDLCAGFGVLALGHNHPCYRDIWQELADCENAAVVHAMGDVYPSLDKVHLIEALCRILPQQNQQVALALSGSQAVELAMKTAMLASKRSGFICFKDAYHGLDLGSLQLTFRPDFREPFADLLGAAVFAENCADETELAAELDRMTALLADKSQQPAAVVVEVVQGRAGVMSRTKLWLQALRNWCDQRGVLLIYDEIFTGLGRIGCWSYSGEVRADISCFGKTLGGGLPLSACVADKSLMQYWPQNYGEAIHTGTFFGHPLACRLGVRTLDYLHEHNLAQRAVELGAKAVEVLHEYCEGLAGVKAIRGKGIMLGIEFRNEMTGVHLMNDLRRNGIIALPSGADGRCLSITPALNIEEDLLLSSLRTIAKLAATY